MRNTRSQGVAPFSVARSNNSSNKNSTCGKRRVSIDSTDSISNCKRININAHSTRRPVSSVNKHYDDEDDNLESEEDKADVLEEEDEEEEDEDDEGDSDEIFNRLATRINTNQQGRLITQSNNPCAPDNDVENENLPSIKEYKNVLDQWPPARIAVVARTQKKKGTAVPPHILTEAIAIQKLYKQQKAMLSIMGNISNGELGGRRKPGCYQLWLKYSKERQKHRMPLKGGSKDILANRNQKLGKIWNSLPDEHQEVFNPLFFYILSGLPPPSSPRTLDDNDENEHGPVPRLDLEPEHRAELQALYDELVCKDKVAKQYAKVSAGMGQGPSLPDYNRQSQKCIERIHTQIENKANNMDFSYYLLACSTHASTEAPSGSPGWCLEFTSHDEMAIYVNKQSNFARVFAARTQGLSVAEVVAQTIGSKVMSNTEKARKTDPGDIVKANLAALLQAQFSALIGKEQGFPRAPDPVSILRNDFNIKIIQMPDSKLPSAVLNLGFNKMNSRQSLWLEDVKAKMFKMEKINTNPTGEEEIQADDSGGEEELTMTQDNCQYQGVDEMEVEFDDESEDLQQEEEKEWNGLEYMENSE
ncbi:hypothetical protein DFH28DRAFT_889165 [Melampsora americana]|nr:hypothetical protein DFH28DRAFT_889165 [Melampsora americana]